MLTKSSLIFSVLVVFGVIALLFFFDVSTKNTNRVLNTPNNVPTSSKTQITDITSTAPAQTSKKNSDAFKESFDEAFTIEENWPVERSSNPNWWVSSGAYFFSESGIGRTLKGDLNLKNRWVSRYQVSNAKDTNNGLRPQNIFRLVLRKQFLDGSQEVYARITHYDTSESEYRNESNGILFFNRYQDENNLYYAGIRVDGRAVIKKKLEGRYVTLGIVKVFDTGEKYNRDTNPNILPLNSWIGVKSVIHNVGNGSVQLGVYVDREQTGEWERVLSVLDDGVTYGSTITNTGYGGIRTDFMDVEFDNYQLVSLP